jgi:hypothetical protein
VLSYIILPLVEVGETLSIFTKSKLFGVRATVDVLKVVDELHSPWPAKNDFFISFETIC